MESDTLARRLGTTPHLSPLLMKARRLGLSAPEDLERLAIRRGLRYYDGLGDSMLLREEASRKELCTPTADLAQFSNEELAVALLSMVLPHSQQRQRMGAAIMGAEGNSPAKIAALARQERSEVIVRHIALCGRKVEPENVFWQELLARLPETILPEPDVLPHLTRFVAMTGFTRRGRETIMQWIRPTRPAAA